MSPGDNGITIEDLFNRMLTLENIILSLKTEFDAHESDLAHRPKSDKPCTNNNCPSYAPITNSSHCNSHPMHDLCFCSNYQFA